LKHSTTGERIAQIINYALLLLLAFLCLFPFYYVVVVSLSTEAEVIRKGGLVWFPDNATLAAYEEMFSPRYGLLRAYQITLFRAVAGTALCLFFTFITSYPLSKAYLPGRGKFTFFIVFTLLFNGGLVPTYLVVKYLGLVDTVWALILPGVIGAFNVIIMKSFFEQLPPEIEESARVDGAGELQTMVRILFPLTLPVMATVGLFYAVWHWNSYFDGIMYINSPDLQPLQVVLRNILLNVASNNTELSRYSAEETVSTHAVKLAAVVMTTVPILLVYPFAQKYFTQGATLGAVKG